MRDFETPNKLSRGSFTYAKFAQLKQLAKNTIGESNEIYEIELNTLIIYIMKLILKLIH